MPSSTGEWTRRDLEPCDRVLGLVQSLPDATGCNMFALYPRLRVMKVPWILETAPELACKCSQNG